MNIYYGNESLNKEKFIFEKIDPEKKTLIIVPDQFSLQTEQNVLEHFKIRTGRSALTELMVTDFSSLGRKVVRETGSREPELIDRYGRHMLLTVIIERLAGAGRLKVYEKMSGKSSFTANANQLISEMKRCGTDCDDISEVTRKTDGFLKLKLEDINEIFGEYEKTIAGRFTDSEDYIRLYGSLFEKSGIIRDAVIWIYGFDTFTPLNMELLHKLQEAAKAVNIVMTYDDGETQQQISDARMLTLGGGEGLFDLTGHVIKKLEEVGAPAEVHSISCDVKCSIWQSEPEQKITIAETSNIYAEAERVAAHIIELVRDRNFRYRDIAVICNDMDVRGGILKRTFDRWGIPAFADRKRSVLHQPVVRFLLSFLEVIADGYDDEAIMGMAGAGLIGWSREDEELLANYVNEAGIRGSRWKKEFTWMGREERGSRYTEEELVRLNEMRAFIIGITESARDEIGRRNSAGEKVRGLYSFLEKEFGIKTRIEELIDRQNQIGLAEGAAETAQSWNTICGLFTQILRVIGDDGISNRQLRDIISSGLEEMEIGLVPTSTDCVLIGTLQRTRISRIRSLIVTGANEGILPMQSSDTGLLTQHELEILEELSLNAAKKESVRRQEEQLAIYRMFSLPEEELYVTCSLADGDGKSTNPSSIFSMLREMKDVKMLGDIDKGAESEMIVSEKGTMPYMAKAMQGFIENGSISDIWLKTMNWYSENNDQGMNRIREGLAFSGKIERLSNELAESLYFGDRNDIIASASRLETYSQCPFRHFVDRGLNPEEMRKFDIDGRSRGDVYHSALQILSQQLMPPQGVSVTDENSPWMTISEEECKDRIKKILLAETSGYREGVYLSDNEKKLQLERIIENCSGIAWAMIGQVRKSKVSSMFFEEPFGRGGKHLKPIEIELKGGRKAVLSGRIDRIDIIDIQGEEGPENAVRIIDYKTGSETVNREYIEKGYKLQLMMYMNAINESGAFEENVPAGVFYFKIRNPAGESAGAAGQAGNGATLEEKIAKDCILEGIFVDDEKLIKAMDNTIEPRSSGLVLPVNQLKDGQLKVKQSSEMISGEDFRELCEKTIENVRRICSEIQEGRIDIAPKKEKRKSAGGESVTACRYCSYKSICMFDTSFRNCRYETI